MAPNETSLAEQAGYVQLFECLVPNARRLWETEEAVAKQSAQSEDGLREEDSGESSAISENRRDTRLRHFLPEIPKRISDYPELISDWDYESPDFPDQRIRLIASDIALEIHEGRMLDLLRSSFIQTDPPLRLLINHFDILPSRMMADNVEIQSRLIIIEDVLFDRIVMNRTEDRLRDGQLDELAKACTPRLIVEFCRLTYSRSLLVICLSELFESKAHFIYAAKATRAILVNLSRLSAILSVHFEDFLEDLRFVSDYPRTLIAHDDMVVLSQIVDRYRPIDCPTEAEAFVRKLKTNSALTIKSAELCPSVYRGNRSPATILDDFNDDAVIEGLD